MQGRQIKNLIGKVFGRLTVKKLDHVDRKSYWLCQCSCGKTKVAPVDNLQNGNTTSCGCVHHDMMIRRNHLLATHGATRNHNLTGAYKSYRSAKKRCTNEKNASYDSYGGRGIKFLFHTFEDFYNELGDRPDGMSIERIDTNGHYEAGNVTWATPAQQNQNRRNSRALRA